MTRQQSNGTGLPGCRFSSLEIPWSTYNVYSSKENKMPLPAALVSADTFCETTTQDASFQQSRNRRRLASASLRIQSATSNAL